PYTESLHGSKDGKHLAWVVNEKGVRNIWYTSLGATPPTLLTSYNTDDGLGIVLQALTPEHLFYVRGNANNRNGEPANPASLSPIPQRQLLRLRLADKQIDTLAPVGSMELSPDGKTLIYTKGKKVYRMPAAGSPEPKEELLLEVRAGVSSLTWSPDGTKMAFVSPRTDHSFVGVFEPGTDRIQWISPGLGFDEHPVWSPDGKRLAFLRRPGRSKDELRNLTGGNSFEIWVGSLETGNALPIWKSPSDDGGFAQYYPNTPLRWTKQDQILFYSEHGGWNHIYKIRPDGAGLTDLTPGACITENSSLSTDQKYLYSSGNCGDINRRHIWRTDITSGVSEQVTGQSGIQSHVVGLEGNAFAYREGLYNQPTTAMLQKDGTAKTLGPLDPQFPKGSLVEPQAVTFRAADGLEIHGQLFTPPPGAGNKKPALIYMHGGPIRQMLLGYHYSGYYANAYSMNQYMASRGYVVLSVNYRSGIGYGRDFRRAAKQGPRGASEYQDIVAAGKYLQSLERVNPEKIGLWGGSYGGYLTAMGLARNSGLFKAGVDLHGVHDWAWRGRDFSPGGGWGLTEELMSGATAASPIADLSAWTSPVLLISGDDDRNVMIGQSIDLKNQLDSRGVYNEHLVFPDEVHGFLRYDSWLRAFKATEGFFTRYLK
ncbi:S9 family peptidase, partial [Robiginitalea sp.]|uniref:S9 family peptidase n=1 Tax=Robiginitalea sp. TaxID=1902411 RepID=UPI003C561537